MQKITYDAKNQTYSTLINDNKSFKVGNIKKYPLNTIQKFDVPKRISILSEFADNCNVNDTIIEVNIIGQVQKSQFWFVQRHNNEPKGILKY